AGARKRPESPAKKDFSPRMANVLSAIQTHRRRIMESNWSISAEIYDIPAVINLPDTSEGGCPAVILCHGTASQKNEVGDLFVKLGDKMAEAGIASIRFDFAGCGDSKADQTDLTFYGEVSETEKVYEYLVGHESIDSDRIGIVGFSQGGPRDGGVSWGAYGLHQSCSEPVRSMP